LTYVPRTMDLSLDDIITQTKVGRRGGRGGGGRGGGRRGGGAGGRAGGSFRAGGRAGLAVGGGGRGGGMRARSLNFRRSGNPEGVWSHDKFMDAGGPRRMGGVGLKGSAKLVIGNLDYGVSEADLRELFGEFGQIIDATINYDISGRSLGKADLTFARRSSAQAAITKYSGVPLDGRPMDIQWATPTGLSATTPVPRVLNRLSGGRVGKARGGGGMSASRGQGRGGRGAGGGRGGRGRGGKTTTKAPTAEELDAELDAYVSQSAK